MLKPAIGAAALLVFVDAMKELPATLLLRPFNFETLATRIYGLTAAEQFEEAAVGAVAIVLIGLIPVLLLLFACHRYALPRIVTTHVAPEPPRFCARPNLALGA